MELSADELQRLRDWVEGVKQIPWLFRTREARAFFDLLGEAGIKSAADLPEGTAVPDVAAKLGKSHADLLGVLSRCPFSLMPGA